MVVIQGLFDFLFIHINWVHSSMPFQTPFKSMTPLQSLIPLLVLVYAHLTRLIILPCLLLVINQGKLTCRYHTNRLPCFCKYPSNVFTRLRHHCYKKKMSDNNWAPSSEFVSSSIPSWQTLLRMPSHSEGPGIWLSVWRFLLTHCLYKRAAEVLARLRGCAGSPEPSLLA